MVELSKLIRELKCVLYRNSEAEPAPEACMQLTQEFFKENIFRLLVTCLTKLNLEAGKDATQIVADLQRQQVHYRLIASDYLERNKDLMDVLIAGYVKGTRELQLMMISLWTGSIYLLLLYQYIHNSAFVL